MMLNLQQLNFMKTIVNVQMVKSLLLHRENNVNLTS